MPQQSINCLLLDPICVAPCPTDLLRLSVGLGDVDDLYADLDRALRVANGDPKELLIDPI